jgi:segregation and condensation protein A
MQTSSSSLFFLENFQGPVELLLHLVQKDELEITSLSLSELTKQFLLRIIGKEYSLDQGAEFLAAAATLLYLKSCRLLPSHTLELDLHALEGYNDPNFSILYHLIDYCKFKEAAKKLSHLELSAGATFLRGAPPLPPPTQPIASSCVEHLSPEAFSELFVAISAKAKIHPKEIEEEPWLVSDKIALLKQSLEAEEKMALTDLFAEAMTRDEMIVLFLAILELLKMGYLSAIRQDASIFLIKI